MIPSKQLLRCRGTWEGPTLISEHRAGYTENSGTPEEALFALAQVCASSGVPWLRCATAWACPGTDLWAPAGHDKKQVLSPAPQGAGR